MKIDWNDQILGILLEDLNDTTAQRAQLKQAS